jgi:hypothetical protein
MNTEFRLWRQWGDFREDSHRWLMAMMLVPQLYGAVALGYVWIDIHVQPGRLGSLGAPILGPALLLGYVLCFCVLAAVGLRQLRSGNWPKAILNLALAALTGFLGCCVYYLILLEARRWL